MKYLFSILFLAFILNTKAQLVTAVQSPNTLVTNILLGGGVQVSNIQYSGSASSIGFFNGANTNIGIQSGILMTTGNLEGPKGPNNSMSDGVDNGVPGPSGIASTMLANLIQTNSFYNASVLSFDFIPQGNQISFKYVFGSEEYPEYVGTQYNDVFGFFLSGPNLANPYTNIAKIPGSANPVAINSVNNGAANLGPCSNCAYYFDNTGGPTIQYDGFTKVLTATATVVPCSTYKIILAITDVGDGIYDSGVFLEAKSFTTNSTTISSQIISNISGGTDLYEGCGTVKIVFSRSGDVSTAQTINYTITGSANASDYLPTPFPLSITFAPNETQKEIILTPIADGIVEGDENVVITLLNATPCPTTNPPYTEFIIKDAQPLSVTAPNDLFLICNNDTVVLNANITGGTIYTVNWNNTWFGNPVTVFPTVTTTYTVSVLDQCSGETVSDDMTVNIPNYPPFVLFAANDTAVCGGEAVPLWAHASGGVGTSTILWSTGETNVDTIFVAPTTTSQYVVNAFDSCHNVLGKTIQVAVQTPTADFSYIYLKNDKIRCTDESSSDVIDWLWLWGDGDSSFVQNPEHQFRDTGLYTVTLIVRNIYGCYDTVFKVIRSYPPLEFFIPNAFTPNADYTNDYFSGKGQGFIDFYMEIYDRWGEKIFDSDVYGRGWTGKTPSGADIPIGVYVYRFELKTPPGKKYYYSGHVTLVR